MSNVINMSNLTAPEDYTKEELIEMLQNARISRKSKKGSAPKGNGKPRHKTSELEESSSGSNNSDSSSTSSEKKNLSMMRRRKDQLPPKTEEGCKRGKATK